MAFYLLVLIMILTVLATRESCNRFYKKCLEETEEEARKASVIGKEIKIKKYTEDTSGPPFYMYGDGKKTYRGEALYNEISEALR